MNNNAGSETLSLLPLWICIVGVLSLFAWQVSLYTNLI
jgi:hypothetical protein